MQRVIPFIICTILFSRISFGQAIQDLLLTHPDGHQVALRDVTSQNLLTVIFVSINCPYSKYYENRLNQLVQDYSGEVQFILVNSNISEFNLKPSFNINKDTPYYLDKDQKVADRLGARKCPQAVVLKKEGNSYSIVYTGAIDDSPQIENDVRETFLKNTLDKLIDGKNISLKETRPTGCMIRLSDR